MPPSDSVLMITLPPGLGGVERQAEMAGRLMQAHGLRVTAAWRAHYASSPHLSAPSWRPWQAPRSEPHSGLPWQGIAVGSRLPELEWAHHMAWEPWRRLIDAHDRIVVVSGNALPGLAPLAMDRRAVSWIASPYVGDRKDRVAAWPRWRRLYDAALNAWVAERQERRLLNGIDTWTIGDYALGALRALAPCGKVHGVIVIPVDTRHFNPDGRRSPSAAGDGFRIGASGRLSDPRKNMRLLVQAFANLLTRQPDAELHVRGDLDRRSFVAAYDAGRLGDALVVGPPVPREGLPDFLRSLDCFALTSHQEGLSQIAMEAMACGTCVVSTRCGGPEEFVLDGETGLLTSFAASDVAEAFARLAGDAALRRRLGAAGAGHVARTYSPARFEAQFMAAFRQVFA